MKKYQIFTGLLVSGMAVFLANGSALTAPKPVGVNSGSCTRREGFVMNRVTSCIFPRLQGGEVRFNSFYTGLRRIEYTGGVGANVRVYTPTMREVYTCQIDRNQQSCDLSRQSDAHLEIFPNSDGTTQFILHGS